MYKQVFEMKECHNRIIECFEAWWEVANTLFRLLRENVNNDWCVGSIFGHQFLFLLIQRP